MKTWEYSIRAVPDGKVYEVDLNALGKMGWELVSVVCEGDMWLVFKRPDHARTLAMMEMDRQMEESHCSPPPMEDGCNCPSCKRAEAEDKP